MRVASLASSTEWSLRIKPVYIKQYRLQSSYSTKLPRDWTGRSRSVSVSRGGRTCSPQSEGPWSAQVRLLSRSAPPVAFSTVTLRRLQLCPGSCVVDPDLSGFRSLGPWLLRDAVLKPPAGRDLWICSVISVGSSSAAVRVGCARKDQSNFTLPKSCSC